YDRRSLMRDEAGRTRHQGRWQRSCIEVSTVGADAPPSFHQSDAAPQQRTTFICIQADRADQKSLRPRADRTQCTSRTTAEDCVAQNEGGMMVAVIAER